MAQAMFSGHSAIEMLSDSKKATCAVAGCGAAVQPGRPGRSTPCFPCHGLATWGERFALKPEVLPPTELSIRIQTHPGRERERAWYFSWVFETLVQITRSHVGPCWELDLSVTGLSGWKRGYVLGKQVWQH